MQRMESQGTTIRLWDDYTTTLERAAAAIGKINRFQGRLRVPHWTVLHHSYLAYEVAARDFEESGRSAFARDVYFHCLIHDLIETLWGDVNGHVKTEEQRIGETQSTRLLCNSLGVDFPAGRVAKKVHEIDRRCLYAEAVAFGDPHDQHIKLLSSLADPATVEIAQSVRQTFWRPEFSNQPDGELVKVFLREVEELLPTVSGR